MGKFPISLQLASCLGDRLVVYPGEPGGRAVGALGTARCAARLIVASCVSAVIVAAAETPTSGALRGLTPWPPGATMPPALKTPLESDPPR